MNKAASMSLRARINNYAKRERVSPQLALQGFFIERFLARIERSEYAGNLVIKGGTLMCSILGLPQRTTMDIDATVVGLRADEATVLRIVEDISSMDVGDGVSFRRNTIANRRSEAFLSRWRETVRDIASSDFQKQQWTRYQKRMPYAREIPFDDLIGSLSALLEKTVDA